MTALQGRMIKIVCINADILKTPGKWSGRGLLKNVEMDNSED